jgi:transposase-like protein
VTKDLGIADSRLRNWIRRADVDAGRREGLTASERAELVELRRNNRRLEMENKILRRGIQGGLLPCRGGGVDRIVAEATATHG